MDIEQCIEVMRSLKEAYQRTAQLGAIPLDKVLELKHTVTELELLIITIKQCMKNIETKQNISMKNGNKNK